MLYQHCRILTNSPVCFYSEREHAYYRTDTKRLQSSGVSVTLAEPVVCSFFFFLFSPLYPSGLQISVCYLKKKKSNAKNYTYISLERLSDVLD